MRVVISDHRIVDEFFDPPGGVFRKFRFGDRMERV
jgi:hypothetical protein